MALNINYQGDIYDSDENMIDCYFQAFSTNISKWSDIRQSESGQYNVNFGDGDLNTQSGSVRSGDALVVVFWSGGETRNDEHDIFSTIVFVYDGNDNTIQNVQLLGPHNPDCSFTLTSDANIGNTVYATSRASTTYQWTFENKIHYQRKEWYGQTVLGFLDIATDNFDFGDGYSTESTHVYDSAGTYDVYHLVESTYTGFNSTCQLQTKIHYRGPTGELTLSNDNPFLNDTITVFSDTSDIDSRITKIEHFFDTEFIDTNTILDYQYDKNLDVFGSHSVSQKIYWNDYYDDRILVVSKDFSMQNKPPNVSLSISQDDTQLELYTADAAATDDDGYIANICWKLYYKAGTTGFPDPFFKCSEPIEKEYSEIYSECNENKTSQAMVFAIPGEYKLSVTVYDDYGDSASDSKEFLVTDICDGVFGECPPCPDCPDCPENDCYNEIRKAVDECIAQYRIESKESGTGIIIVQDGRASNIASGEVSGSVAASIRKEDIVAAISNNIKGSVSTSKTSSTVGGRISGKVKK